MGATCCAESAIRSDDQYLTVTAQESRLSLHNRNESAESFKPLLQDNTLRVGENLIDDDFVPLELLSAVMEESKGENGAHQGW